MPDLKDYLLYPWLRIVAGCIIWYFSGIEGSFPSEVSQWWGRLVFGILGGVGLIIWGLFGLRQNYKKSGKIKITRVEWLLYLITLFLLVFGSLYVLVSSGIVDLGGPSQAESEGEELKPETPTLVVQTEPITQIPTNSGEMDLISFVVAFYESINNAGNESDLVPTLQHLGALPKDSSFWWKFQVRYEIYRCPEPTIVYIGLTYFYRTNGFTTPQNDDPEIVKYGFDKFENEWFFVSGDNKVGAVSSSCTLAATNWP